MSNRVRMIDQRRYTDEEMEGLLSTLPSFEYEEEKPVEAPVEPEKRGIAGTLTSSLARGIDNTQAGIYAGGALLANALGAEGARDSLLKGYERNTEEAAQNAPEIGSISNIGSLGDAGTWALEAIGELGPSLALMFGTGGIGGAAAPALAKVGGEKIAARYLTKRAASLVAQSGGKMSADTAQKAAVKELGRMAGAWAGSSAVEAGHMYGTDVSERGVENANAMSAALLGGISGATDVLLGGEGQLIRGLAGKFGSKVAGALEGKLATEMIKGAGREFGQEALQEFLAVTNEVINEHGAANADIGDTATRLVDAGAKGAVGGMGFGAVKHVGNKAAKARADREAMAGSEQDKQRLADLDYEQQAAELEAREKATEESEMRRASGESMSSILSQRLQALREKEADFAQRRTTPEGRQSIIDEEFGKDSQANINQARINNQRSDLELARQAELEEATRQQVAQSQPVGTTPFTHGLGTGIDALGTIDSVANPQSQQLPSDGALEAEWAQAEAQRDAANFDNEMQRRRAEAQAKATEGVTPLMQRVNDKIRRKQAGLSVSSPLTANDIDAAIRAVKESGAEQSLDMKDWLKTLEDAKKERPNSDYMGEWLTAVGKARTQRSAERDSIAAQNRETLELTDVMSQVAAPERTALMEKINQRARQERDGTVDKSPLTPEEANAAILMAKRSGVDNELDLNEWMSVLEEAKSIDSRSDYMGEWLSAIDKARTQRVTEQSEANAREEFLSVMEAARAERDSEREASITEQSKDWRNSESWRQYRDIRRKQGREITPEEEAAFANGVRGSSRSAQKSRPKTAPIQNPVLNIEHAAPQHAESQQSAPQQSEAQQAAPVSSPVLNIEHSAPSPSVDTGGGIQAAVSPVQAAVSPTQAPVSPTPVGTSPASSAPTSAPVAEVPGQTTPAETSPVEAITVSDKKLSGVPISEVKAKVQAKSKRAAEAKPAQTAATVEAENTGEVQPESGVDRIRKRIKTDSPKQQQVQTEVKSEQSKSDQSKSEQPGPDQPRTTSLREALTRKAEGKAKSDSKSAGLSKSVLDLFGGVLESEGVNVKDVERKVKESRGKDKVKKTDTVKATQNKAKDDDVPFMRDEDILGDYRDEYSDRPKSSDDGEYFSKVKRKIEDKRKAKAEKNEPKSKVESKPEEKPQSKPEEKSPVKNLTPIERTVENVKREQEDAKARAESLTQQAKSVFGKETSVTPLPSGNVIAVLKNGSAILIRQQDVIIADKATGQKAYGSWLDESMVAERYGIQLNRGGIVTLAKYQKDTTALHESFHAAMSLALSPTERKIILKHYGNEEAAAEAYERWTPGKETETVPAKGLFQKIFSMFKGIANMFSSDTKPTSPDDVFSKVRKGEAFKQHTTKTENKKGGAAAEARLSDTGELFSVTAVDEIVFNNPNDAQLLRKVLGGEKKGKLDKASEMVTDLARGDTTSWSTYLDGAFAGIRQSTFDVLDRIRVVEEMYNAKTGKKDMEAYWTNRLITSVDSVVSAFLQHGPIKWKDGVSSVDGVDTGFLEIARKLGSNTHYWLMRRVANRAEALAAQGRENLLSDTEIKRLKEIAAENSVGLEAEFDLADKQYEALQKSVLEFCQEAGIISEDFIETVHSAEYIPFYRMTEDSLGDVKEGVYMPSGVDIQNGIKKLKGSENVLDDPLTNVVKNWTILITQAMRNNARRKTLDIALGASEGMTNPFVSKVSIKLKGEDDVMNVMVNGKSEYYRIHDRALYAAMDDSLVYKDRHALWKAANKAKRILTVGATSAPPFVVKNFIRDSIQNIVFNKNVKISDIFDGVVKSLTEHPDFIALKAAGGAFSHGYLHGSNPQSVHNYVEEIVIKDGKRQWVKRNLKGVWDKWQKIGSAIENANRVALYSRLKAEGKSDMEAAYEAKDLLDFSMRGGSKVLNDFTYVIPFLNARIAGLYKLKRALGKRGEDGSLEVASTATMLAAASMGLLAYNMTANKEEWDKLTNEDRWTYYHFWLPDGTHIRMPKPFEVGAIFSSLPEVVAEMVFGEQDSKYFWKYMQWTTTNTFAMNLTPQIIKPAVENWGNRNSFTDQPIVPFGMEHLAPTLQYREHTPETIKAFSKFVETIDGDLDPGFLNWIKSPVRLEHLIRGYFATLGTMTVFTSDVIGRTTGVFPSKHTTAADFSGGLLKDDSIAPSRYVNQFYDYAAEIDRFTYTLNALKKSGDKEAVRDYFEENLDLVKNKGVVNKARSVLSQIRAQRILISNSKTLSPEEKYKRIQKLVEKRNEIVKPLITKYGLI